MPYLAFFLSPLTAGVLRFFLSPLTAGVLRFFLSRLMARVFHLAVQQERAFLLSLAGVTACKVTIAESADEYKGENL